MGLWVVPARWRPQDRLPPSGGTRYYTGQQPKSQARYIPASDGKQNGESLKNDRDCTEPANVAGAILSSSVLSSKIMGTAQSKSIAPPDKINFR